VSQLGSTEPDAIADKFRSRGHRWTPQRRLILDVLGGSTGHVTGSDLVERCRARDPHTTASTVYRTLDVLEELGYVSHSHSANGREEFHLLPHEEHGHVECRTCGRSWEIDPALADEIAAPVSARLGFHVDVGHTTLVGQCSECAAANTG
jgi:Fur family ferric uptake transcriptional regulator